MSKIRAIRMPEENEAVQYVSNINRLFGPFLQLFKKNSQCLLEDNFLVSHNCTQPTKRLSATFLYEKNVENYFYHSFFDNSQSHHRAVRVNKGSNNDKLSKNLFNFGDYYFTE